MMKRIFTILLLLSLFIPVSFAQGVDRSGGYARILSLGNNPYVVDPEGIKINPAWASEYSNFIWGDIGSNGNGGAFGNTSVGQFFGGNFDVGHGLTIGGMLTRNDFNSISIGRLDPLSIAGLGVVNLINTAPGASAIALNNNLELLAAYKIGKMSLGFGFLLHQLLAKLVRLKEILLKHLLHK